VTNPGTRLAAKRQLAESARVVLTFLIARIKRMGAADAGAYEYYAARARNRTPLYTYERRLWTLLRGERLVVHAGTGFGVLPAALARAGVDCIAFERDRRRFAGAVALREALPPTGAYEILNVTYPETLEASARLAQATLVFTNVEAGWDDALEAAVLDTFKLFRRVILDERMFGRKRDTPGERAILERRIAERGFTVERLPIRDYFFVRVTASGRRHPAPNPAEHRAAPRRSGPARGPASASTGRKAG
jgi:hypothetical protein